MNGREYVLRLPVAELRAILGDEAQHANTVALLDLAVDAAVAVLARDEPRPGPSLVYPRVGRSRRYVREMKP